MKVLGKTMIGSHIWKMNTPKSDEDYFEIYIEPTESIFRGIAKHKSIFTQKDNVDTHQHEVGKVIDQVIKGNINFIIGITSPLVIKTNEHFDKLKEITLRNLSKNTFHSINGMATHNYKKYIVEGRDTSERKCNQILRTLEFGIALLKRRELKYEPYSGGTPELIEEKIKEMNDSFEKSTIPDKPDEDEFRSYLSKIRKWDWWDNLKV